MPVTIDSSNIIIDRGASNVYVDIVKTKGYIKKNNVAICIPELEEEYSYNDGIYNYNIFTYNKDIYPSLNIDNSNLIVHWKFDNHNLFHNYSMKPASINVNMRNISNIYSNGVIDLNNKYIGVGSLFKSDQNDIYGYNITPANWMSELLKKEATFTFWIKQTYSSSTNIDQTIFSHDNTFVVKQEKGNFIVYMETDNNSYYDNVASFLFTYNTWVHIAIVINLNANTDINNVINIYRNGELLNSTLNTYVNTYSGIIGTGFPNNNNNNIFRFLSGSETNLNSGFKGNLDDFRIYNKCLSGAEIYDLYNNYKSTKYNIKFENDTYCDMLIVAGGGGGSRRMGGGGGAGALIFDNFTFRKNKEYILKIGKGGLGVDTPGNIGGEITTSMKTGENGGDSEIINEDICIYRAAGGGGGQGGGTLAGQNAASGGSGGGSGGKDYLHGGLLSNNNIVNGNSISVYRNYYDSGDAPRYNSSKVFGNEGGIGNGDNPNGGGGGGGAGSRGFDSFAQNPNNNNIIKGGDGIHSVDNIDFKSFFSIKNTNIGHHYRDKVYFSGGGGGGNWDGSIYYNDGGLGGGGRSGMSSTLRLPNINGMINTGGGGGGEGKDEYGGGHGGSGVIILKYKLNKIDSSQEYDAQWKYKRNTSNVYFMGNVGIGTKSNPEYSLNVQGDINITGDLYKNGALIEYPKYLVKTDDVEISRILDLSLYKDSIDENFTSTPSILYKYHILTFEGTSGYTSTTDGNQRTYNINFPEDAVADILIVAGGGGGGGSIGGGGGGGSVIYSTGIQIPANTYTIKVGKGGSGGIDSTDGTNGYNSEAFGAIALGGGRGGDYNISGSRASGGSGGGTGGGANIGQGVGIALAGNKTISSSSLLYSNYSYYANDGGNSLWQDGSVNETTGGGGGGAGTKGSSFNGVSYGGSAVNNDFIGKGGDGIPIGITGVSVYYGAGGGGGSHKGGLTEWLGKSGGLGGGGNGGGEFSNGTKTSGTDGTGYGAGGGGGAYTKNGGNGGSGIIIIRYYTIPKLINNDILTPYGDIYKYSIISKYKYLVLTHSGGTEDQTIYQINFPQNTSCDILVVGGGGCGADASWTGGGGAGGVIYYRKQLQGTYTIKVGKGGGPQDTTEDQQSTINSGKNGKNSEILDSGGNVLFRAIGGSMGTRQVGTGFQIQVFEGGSTGGSGYRDTNPLYSGVGNLSSQNIINGSAVSIINAGGTASNTDRYNNTPYGVDEYGNQYGMFGHRGGTYPSGTLHRGGGGGGAGGVGINGDATLTNSSDGGVGKDMSSIFGTNVGENGWFAGGGGGSGLYDLGVGGMGGGGDGKKDVKGEDGMAGTGGGGGAYTHDAVTTYFTGGNGGSGIVIIRHLSKYISGVEVLSQWNYNYIGNVYNLGNVGIGTTNPKTELDVIGDITGNTKNFKINHPLISNKWLYHGTIEAPRYENLYRGRKIIKNGKGFINIDKECNSTGGMSVGTFLALNSNCDLYLQNNTTYDRVIGYIENGIIKVQCENINDEIEIDWLVISERKDGSLINTPSTNYQGKMICEHKIEDTLI
jgi:hypothetical protein